METMANYLDTFRLFLTKEKGAMKIVIILAEIMNPNH